MMGWYRGDWGAPAFMGMGVMLLFWGSIIGLVVWAVVRTTRTEPTRSVNTESARSILDRRLASGEIDADEYASTRRTLEA
jgi:putative membrane protein